MEYIEVNFNVKPQEPGNDFLMAVLADIDYESFVETTQGIKAYIRTDDFDEEKLKSLSIFRNDAFAVDYNFKTIADQNWNAKWEENYPPVIISDQVVIRAPFHQAFPQVEYDIVIEPKMSFGTAHHATTAQMIKFLLQLDLTNMDVLDMGTGTAVLAILASLRGANHIDAIDNDQWAYHNAVENVQRNKIKNIRVEMGDASLLNGNRYNLVIANINRNILLNDIKFYANTLSKNGLILFSGFYEKDIPILNKEAEKNNLFYQEHSVENDWVAGLWKKK